MLRGGECPPGDEGGDQISPEGGSDVQVDFHLDRGLPIDWDIESLVRGQRNDPLFKKVIQWLEGERGKDSVSSPISLDRFILEDRVLYVAGIKGNCRVSYRTALPQSFIREALYLCHSTPLSGHLGVSGTLDRVEKCFYWPKYVKDVKEFVQACHLCNLIKPHNIKSQKARLWPIPKAKWSRVHIDLIGPLPLCCEGNRYIFVLIDSLTRFCFLEALVDKSCPAVAKDLYNFINIFSCPQEIISDCGTEFVGKVFQEIVSLYHIKHSRVLAYRPSSNGLVENKNKSVMNILRYFVQDDPRNWSQYLKPAMFALNSAYNRAIGDSSFFLVFGQDPVLPYEVFTKPDLLPVYNVDNYKSALCNLNKRIFKTVAEFLKRAQHEYCSDYDMRHKTENVTMEVGSRVYVKRLAPRQHKLQSKFVGPFRIKEDRENNVVLVDLVRLKEVSVHKDYVILRPQNEFSLMDTINFHAPFPTADDICSLINDNLAVL